jgi:hypothetical protein
MFCSKCGENLAEGIAFCPKCGAKVGDGVSNTIGATVQPVQFQQVTEISNPAVIKILRVLSIIGFVFFPLGIFGFYSPTIDEDTVFGLIFLIFGYALAHAIVALVQGGKHKLKVMTVMAVLGIIWYVLSSIFIIALVYEDWEASQGWAILGLGYAIAFSIVTFVKAKLKSSNNIA